MALNYTSSSIGKTTAYLYFSFDVSYTNYYYKVRVNSVDSVAKTGSLSYSGVGVFLSGLSPSTSYTYTAYLRYSSDGTNYYNSGVTCSVLFRTEDDTPYINFSTLGMYIYVSSPWEQVTSGTTIQRTTAIPLTQYYGLNSGYTYPIFYYGTSGTKLLLWDEDGNVVSSGTSRWTIDLPSSGGRSVTVQATPATYYYYYLYYAYNYTGSPSTYWTTDSSGATTGKSWVFTIPTSSPSRSGYTFLGWNTASDGSGTWYYSSYTKTHTSSSPSGTLYAQWEKIVTYSYSCSLAYNYTGASTTYYDILSYGPTTDESHGFTLTGPPTRTNYQFDGWNTKSDGTGTTYAVNATYTCYKASPDKTLYAQWTYVEPSVDYYFFCAYNYDGSPQTYYFTDTGSSNTGTYTFTTPATPPTRTGYTFLNWNTNSAGTGTAYGNSASFICASENPSRTLYAQWRKDITKFWWDGAEGNTDESIIYSGAPISNLTATNWNRFRAKVKEISDEEGQSYSYSDVSSGDTFMATDYNAVRTAIDNLTGHGTLPSSAESGDRIMASYFLGSGSLRNALNTAIDEYNN